MFSDHVSLILWSVW